MRPRSSGPPIGLVVVGGVFLLSGILSLVLAHQVIMATILLLVGIATIGIGLLVGRGTAPTLTPPIAAPSVAPPPVPLAIHDAPAVPVIPEAPPAIPGPPPVTIILPALGPLFIGREQALEDLTARLRRGRGSGAIAVFGPAGCGKTTLIGQAIDLHRAEGTFFDGISWHTCTDYHGDVGLRRLLIEVLDRFGGPLVAMTSTMRMGEAAVTDLIRGKRILFWLDDVPTDFPIGRALTTLTTRDDAGNGPTVLIASRIDWDMPEIAELELEMPPMDEALDHLRGWMDLAGRSTGIDDYDALKAICLNVGSLPLALRLAAGIAAMQSAKLPKLAADLGSAVYPPGDHLRAAERTIAFVERALFPQSRQIFATFGVFEESLIDLDTAVAVAVAATGIAPSEVRHAIESMGMVGLLEADGTEQVPALRLHPLIRAYVRTCFAELSPIQAARARAAMVSILATRRAAHEQDEAAVTLRHA